LALIGLLVILITALLLFILGWLLDRRDFFRPRRFSAIKAMKNAQTAAIEAGLSRHVFLGGQFHTTVYPGLGLLSLAALPWFGRGDSRADGRQQISTGDSQLFLMSRQVLEGSYRDGFSAVLQDRPGLMIPGLTAFSTTAGLLPILLSRPHGSLSLIGHFGPEAALWAEAVTDEGGPAEEAHVFAAAGTLEGQAVLYLMIRDVLVGEEVFAVPASLSPTPFNLASLQTQDVLRVLLILALILGAVLKMLGIL
jgi:hypothetical protein